MIRNLWCVAAVGMIASACASSPNQISTQYVSPVQYQSYDCEQLGLEQARIERRTGDLYRSLKREADADAWQMGIGLILFWPTLFMLEGGDGPEAAEYARLKGEYEAIQDISVQKKCELDFMDDLNQVAGDIEAESEEKETSDD